MSNVKTPFTVDNNNWEEAPKTAELRDPVCGMWVDPPLSAGTRMLRGESVFFCSTLCLKKFDLNPEHYLPEHEPHAGGTEAAR